MPNIRASSDIRNNYNEISRFCHQYDEPIYITKSGKGDLAVLSIEAYEKLMGSLELSQLLCEGLNDIKEGKSKPFNEVFSDLRKEFQQEPKNGEV
ncbi:MAG: type II toxin-antitoxin system prevent-host-death family antitoxin [Oscillospiraceae bacterium]